MLSEPRESVMPATETHGLFRYIEDRARSPYDLLFPGTAGTRPLTPEKAAAPEDVRYVDTGRRRATWACAQQQDAPDDAQGRPRGPPYVRKGRRVLYDIHAPDTWMEDK